MNLSNIFIDSTHFAIDKSNISCADYSCTKKTKLACASLLKPLYMWSVSHLETFDYPQQDWSQMVQQAVTLSSNNVTTEIWNKYGASTVLTQLENMTAINFFKTGITSWGNVQINADMVARGYGAMLIATTADQEAAKIAELMKKVPQYQTFGLINLASKHCGVPVGDIGIKCGWYIDELTNRLRTHAVVTVKLRDDRYKGFVILTSIRISPELTESYLKTYREGTEVLPIHEELSGSILRDELTRLLLLTY